MKRRRNELTLTQEDVADRLGIVVRQYQKIEAGQVNVTLRTLCRIAMVLDVSVEKLLESSV
jgi:transcriptional regulator with XRE-family HTH domain